MKKAFIVILVVFIVGVVIVGGFICNFVGQSVEVLKKETNPQALLDKYRMFKTLVATIDEKGASIKVYAKRVTDMEADYEGTARKDWDRIDKQQLSQWRAEVSGLKAVYNRVAADYNVKMSDALYAFCNVGDLPKGAVEVLPREFRAYVVE